MLQYILEIFHAIDHIFRCSIMPCIGISNIPCNICQLMNLQNKSFSKNQVTSQVHCLGPKSRTISLLNSKKNKVSPLTLILMESTEKAYLGTPLMWDILQVLFITTFMTVQNGYDFSLARQNTCAANCHTQPDHSKLWTIWSIATSILLEHIAKTSHFQMYMKRHVPYCQERRAKTC